MSDTPAAIAERVEEMFRKKSPSERLVMGCSMFDLSRELVKSSILREKPDITPSLLRRELFLKFYARDFNPLQQEKILRSWEDHPGAAAPAPPQGEAAA